MENLTGKNNPFVKHAGRILEIKKENDCDLATAILRFRVEQDYPVIIGEVDFFALVKKYGLDEIVATDGDCIEIEVE